jgi:hypothetical protein
MIQEKFNHESLAMSLHSESSRSLSVALCHSLVVAPFAAHYLADMTSVYPPVSDKSSTPSSFVSSQFSLILSNKPAYSPAPASFYVLSGPPSFLSSLFIVTPLVLYSSVRPTHSTMPLCYAGISRVPHHLRGQAAPMAPMAPNLNGDTVLGRLAPLHHLRLVPSFHSPSRMLISPPTAGR